MLKQTQCDGLFQQKILNLQKKAWKCIADSHKATKNDYITAVFYLLDAKEIIDQMNEQEQENFYFEKFTIHQQIDILGKVAIGEIISSDNSILLNARYTLQAALQHIILDREFYFILRRDGYYRYENEQGNLVENKVIEPVVFYQKSRKEEKQAILEVEEKIKLKTNSDQYLTYQLQLAQKQAALGSPLLLAMEKRENIVDQLHKQVVPSILYTIPQEVSEPFLIQLHKYRNWIAATNTISSELMYNPQRYIECIETEPTFLHGEEYAKRCAKVHELAEELQLLNRHIKSLISYELNYLTNYYKKEIQKILKREKKRLKEGEEVLPDSLNYVMALMDCEGEIYHTHGAVTSLEKKKFEELLISRKKQLTKIRDCQGKDASDTRRVQLELLSRMLSSYGSPIKELQNRTYHYLRIGTEDAINYTMGCLREIKTHTFSSRKRKYLDKAIDDLRKVNNGELKANEVLPQIERELKPSSIQILCQILCQTKRFIGQRLRYLGYSKIRKNSSILGKLVRKGISLKNSSVKLNTTTTVTQNVADKIVIMPQNSHLHTTHLSRKRRKKL